MMRPALIAGAGLLLSACSEFDQSKTTEAVNRGDQPAYQGAANAQVAKQWTPGDKASWEKQVRQRGQNQNEYVKTN